MKNQILKNNFIVYQNLSLVNYQNNAHAFLSLRYCGSDQRFIRVSN